MKLRRLTNSEYQTASEYAKLSGIRLDECPTCGSKPFTVKGEGADEGAEAEGRVNGTYRYRGQEHPCDCDTQMQLRKHYLVANVGDQYQRLNWADFDKEDVKTGVDNYLNSWPKAKRLGMGLELSGPGLGTGKTFTATHIAKELIKRGERVYFIPFLQLISLFQLPEEIRQAKSATLFNTTALILDEVRPPRSEAQQWLFSEKFEELIRHRTNFNLPTIIGTNLSEEELSEHYPRPYSLLAAKQVRIEMTGVDNRLGRIAEENMELLLNDEVKPIT